MWNFANAMLVYWLHFVDKITTILEYCWNRNIVIQRIFQRYSLIWKVHNMTSLVSQESQFPEVKENSDAFTAQQRRFLLWPSGRPPVFEHLSRHQSQRAHVRTDVRATQGTPTPASTCLHRCPNSKLVTANSEDNMQPFGR